MKDKRVVFMGTPDFSVPVLEKLIENTKKGIMYGEWNDNGRLLNY